jgi:hypothetical protein
LPGMAAFLCFNEMGSGIVSRIGDNKAGVTTKKRVFDPSDYLVSTQFDKEPDYY